MLHAELAEDNSASIPVHDYDGNILTDSSPFLKQCRVAMAKRLTRPETMPPLNIDPLRPLPLADAAPGGPAVKMVYFILASRKYAHETINRNVNALQRPGALMAAGSNDSNLFLLHVDAKMSAEDNEHLRSRVTRRPDVYFIRRPRPVMWAGWSMVLSLLDAMASLVHRKLGFEYLINLSDADLTLRTDGEIRGFFARFPGRSIMSIVQRNRDPRRYKLHEGFRKNCWVRVSPCFSRFFSLDTRAPREPPLLHAQWPMRHARCCGAHDRRPSTLSPHRCSLSHLPRSPRHLLTPRHAPPYSRSLFTLSSLISSSASMAAHGSSLLRMATSLMA